MLPGRHLAFAGFTAVADHVQQDGGGVVPGMGAVVERRRRVVAVGIADAPVAGLAPAFCTMALRAMPVVDDAAARYLGLVKLANRCAAFGASLGQRRDCGRGLSRRSFAGEQQCGKKYSREGGQGGFQRNLLMLGIRQHLRSAVPKPCGTVCQLCIPPRNCTFPGRVEKACRRYNAGLRLCPTNSCPPLPSF
jgi:hypothetical protein